MIVDTCCLIIVVCFTDLDLFGGTIFPHHHRCLAHHLRKSREVECTPMAVYLLCECIFCFIFTLLFITSNCSLLRTNTSYFHRLGVVVTPIQMMKMWPSQLLLGRSTPHQELYRTTQGGPLCPTVGSTTTSLEEHSTGSLRSTTMSRVIVVLA